MRHLFIASAIVLAFASSAHSQASGTDRTRLEQQRVRLERQAASSRARASQICALGLVLTNLGESEAAATTLQRGLAQAEQDLERASSSRLARARRTLGACLFNQGRQLEANNASAAIERYWRAASFYASVSEQRLMEAAITRALQAANTAMPSYCSTLDELEVRRLLMFVDAPSFRQCLLTKVAANTPTFVPLLPATEERLPFFLLRVDSGAALGVQGERGLLRARNISMDVPHLPEVWTRSDFVLVHAHEDEVVNGTYSHTDRTHVYDSKLQLLANVSHEEVGSESRHEEMGHTIVVNPDGSLRIQAAIDAYPSSAVYPSHPLVIREGALVPQTATFTIPQ